MIVRLISIVLFCTTVVSCENDGTIFKAETVLKDYDSTTISLKITEDTNWIYEIDNSISVNSQFESGKAKITSDSIFFYGSKRFYKAVVRNDYLELMNEDMHIPVVENKTTLFVAKSPLVINDYLFFVNQKHNDFKYFFPLPEDQKKLNLLLNRTFESNTLGFKNAKSNSDYYKQCFFRVDENGQKIVTVYGMSKISTSYEKWQFQLQSPNDGGEHYFNLKINLSTGKIYDIYLHGQA